MKKILKPGTWMFPLPAVMVSCKEKGHRPNIITLSWCGVAASEPPILQISIRPGRHSHDLILKSGEFVVNIPSQKQLKATDFCGNVSGRKVDKFKAAKLTPGRALKVGAPIIKQCPLNLECRVVGHFRLGTHTHILGEVLAIQCDRKILDRKGRPDINKLLPFAFFPVANQYYAIGKMLGKYGFAKGGK
jgi:flavin reductase (DIM6/NTAB) family NADH-FMN oxidoreductase RutF